MGQFINLLLVITFLSYEDPEIYMNFVGIFYSFYFDIICSCIFVKTSNCIVKKGNICVSRNCK